MGAWKLRVVFETGDIAGIGGVTITSELTLHADGTVTGAGVLLAADSELAIAATGEYSEAIVSGDRAVSRRDRRRPASS